MLLNKKVVAAAVSCVLTATLALAQETSPGQGSSRAGTRRSATDFVPPGLVRPDASSPLSLITAGGVAEELGLRPEQKQKLEDLRKATAEKQRELVAELQKRAAETNQEAEAALQKLLDEKQTARIRQLQLQREGITALARPEVAGKLGLNAEQRDKLTKLVEDYRRVAPFAAAFNRGAGTAPGDPPAGTPTGATPGAGSDFRSATARSRENRDRLAAEMIALLTPEQKTNWEAMQGAKFDFPVAQFGTRGGPASSIDFQTQSRARAFELGQSPGNPARARGLRSPTRNLGPAGPFRYLAIVEGLGLSEEQKTQIRAIGGDDVKAIAELRDLPSTDVSARIALVNKATQEKIDKVLTDEQKARLKELTAPPTSARQ